MTMKVNFPKFPNLEQQESLQESFAAVGLTPPRVTLIQKRQGVHWVTLLVAESSPTGLKAPLAFVGTAFTQWGSWKRALQEVLRYFMSARIPDEITDPPAA